MSRRPTRRTTRRAPARRGNVSSRTVIIVVLILIGLYLYESGKLQEWLGKNLPSQSGQQQVPTTVTPATQTPQNTQNQQQQAGGYQVFFTTPSLIYPDRAATRVPSPLLQAVISDVNAATTSIVVAVFDLDLPTLTDALVQAAQRGVQVRAIVDSENLETPEVANETGRLQKAGVPVRFDDREPFMHNKFIVLDGAVAWTGSWNMTENDTFRNNNNFIRMASAEIAADYSAEFDQMFNGTFGTGKTSLSPNPTVQLGGGSVEVRFSPEDGAAAYVLRRIEEAKTSIRFMAFSYTSDPIADAMIGRLGAGIAVQGVIESQNSAGTGSEFSKLQEAGVSVFKDGNCYIMHHKVIIIDDHIVITGSYNFTASAEKSNDENLIIIDNADIAKQYIEEFDRVYLRAQDPTRCS